MEKGKQRLRRGKQRRSLDSSPIITTTENNTVILRKYIWGRKPFSRRKNGPAVPRCSRCGSLHPQSFGDTPSDRERQGFRLRSMSDGTHTATHKGQVPPSREIQRLRVTQSREWATQPNVSCPEGILARQARSFSSVPCVVSFDRVLPSHTALFPD